MHLFSSFPLAESPPRDGQLMRSTVLMCFAANNILLMRNWNHLPERKMADRFPELPGGNKIKKTNLVIE